MLVRSIERLSLKLADENVVRSCRLLLYVSRDAMHASRPAGCIRILYRSRTNTRTAIATYVRIYSASHAYVHAVTYCYVRTRTYIARVHGIDTCMRGSGRMIRCGSKRRPAIINVLYIVEAGCTTYRRYVLIVLYHRTLRGTYSAA